MRIVLLFPGQGSQSPEMLSPEGLWPQAGEDFAAAIPDLGESWRDRLNETTVTQPALVGYSLRAFDKLHGALASHEIVALAGHSLGELTATAVSLGWGLSDSMRLAHQRGLLMQQACQSYGQNLGMQAWLGRELDKKRLISFFDQHEHLWFLNDNGPGQIVIGGLIRDFSQEELSVFGVRKVIDLPVSVVSHCPVLHGILGAWEEQLKTADWGELRYRLFNHTSVCFLGDPFQARENLSAQLVQPVRFHEMILALSSQADLFIEVGPGSVLKNLVRKISAVPCLSTQEALEELVGLH